MGFRKPLHPRARFHQSSEMRLEATLLGRCQNPVNRLSTGWGQRIRGTREERLPHDRIPCARHLAVQVEVDVPETSVCGEGEQIALVEVHQRAFCIWRTLGSLQLRSKLAHRPDVVTREELVGWSGNISRLIGS